MNPYDTMRERALSLDTIDFVLSEAERASLKIAREAFERGDIQQTEVSPGSGIYKLVRP